MYPFKQLNKMKFFGCYLNALIENLCIYLIPLVLSFYTKEPFTLEKFKILIILLISLHIIRLSCDSIWTIYVSTYIQKFKNKLQLSYFNRLYKMRSELLDENHNGFIKKQIDVVVSESESFLRFIMSTVNGFVIAMTIFLYQVYQQDKGIFIFTIGLIILIIIINMKISEMAVKVQKKYNEENAEYNACYVDFLQNIKTVKKLKAIDFSKSKINKKFNDTVLPYKRMKQVVSLRAHGISFLIYFMYFVILISLYFKMKSGENVLSYILFYATIFQGVGRELIDLSGFFSNINSLTAASNRLEEIIEEENSKYITNFEKLELSNIKYQYQEQSNTIIKIDQLVINKNDKVAIIGESGQGKTTVLNIIAKDILTPPENYKINDLKTTKKLDIAFISQETNLFDLTIRENLTLGKEMKDDELLKLIKEAGLENWYNRLKEGLDTRVGEEGLRLSTGQKQRLNLIRGIIEDKEIYILDEPTSNLDKISEEKIIDMITNHLANKTIIIVTHRPDIEKICNKIYEFKENNLVLKTEKLR